MNEDLFLLHNLLHNTLPVDKKLVFKYKGPFPLRAWKRPFIVSFIDVRLKRAVKIEVSAKNINRTNKECSFPRS